MEISNPTHAVTNPRIMVLKPRIFVSETPIYPGPILSRSEVVTEIMITARIAVIRLSTTTSHACRQKRR
jgi:hypothetical protein